MKPRLVDSFIFFYSSARFVYVSFMGLKIVSATRLIKYYGKKEFYYVFINIFSSLRCEEVLQQLQHKQKEATEYLHEKHNEAPYTSSHDSLDCTMRHSL